MNVKVGFIGLGIMGRPMALNLIRGGYPLWVYGRREQSLPPLVEAGAEVCKSPADLAAATDIIITIVSDTRDVEEVLFAPNGVAAGAKKGSLVVDMSTISPQATRSMAGRLREMGVEMLDAPVSGGQIGAVNAALSIMVGGKAEVFQQVKPVFECMGKNIVHLGDNGAGQVAKACNQIIISMTVSAVAEAFVLAVKNGVDPALVRQALLGGFAYSKVLEGHGQRMLDRNFQPGFRAELLQKDIRIVMEAANQTGTALPGTALAMQYTNALVGSDKGNLDSSAIFLILEQLNGMMGRKEQ